MSRHYSSKANEISRIVNEVNDLSPEELSAIYGIIVKEDGTVVDMTYNLNFQTVGEWASFFVEDDGQDDFGDFDRYDDDY